LATKKICIKPDMDITYDAGLARRLMVLLCSYDLHWLSLAVEVLTNQQTADALDLDQRTMIRYLEKVSTTC